MKAPSIVAAALATVALAGCTVHQTEAPALTGPSEFALSLSLTTSPQSISQNGADSSVVTAKVFFTDPNTGGTAPQPNIPVRFDMTVGGVPQDFGSLSARSVVTDSHGVATTIYTAPPSVAGAPTGTCGNLAGTCVTIVATPTDTSSAAPGSFESLNSASATILLTPPGVILPPAGTPIAAFTILPTSSLVNSSVTFDASQSCPTDGTGACTSTGSIVSYGWDFGDGRTGSGVRTTHAYGSAGTFVVTLTVTSDRGFTASSSQTVDITLPPAPSADFLFSPSAPAPGDTVFFNASISTAAPGHNIVQYTWNFGDGSPTVTGQSVSHVYSTAGSYAVILSVVDDTGQRSTKTTNVDVK